MGKASDFDRQMEGRFLRPGERWPVRPDIRVRPDAPSLKSNGTTQLAAVFDRLEHAGRGIVLRDSTDKAIAVVLPADRYAELASCEIESEDRFRAAEGRIEPDPEALEELMIEQVDPAVEWKLGSRIWREPDQQ